MSICSECGGDWITYKEDRKNSTVVRNGNNRWKCKNCGKYSWPAEDKAVQRVCSPAELTYKLIIDDVHIPDDLTGTLDEVLRIKEKYHVADEDMYSTGDFFNLNALKFWDKAPEEDSILTEMDKTVVKLEEWFKYLPSLKIASGNHDRLSDRKATKNGLPKPFVRGLLEVYSAPDGWAYDKKWDLGNNTILLHGDGLTGMYYFANACKKLMCNVILGHTHSAAGIYYVRTMMGLLWGMGLGASVDHTALSMKYGEHNPFLPVPTVGLLRSDGVPFIEPLINLI